MKKLARLCCGCCTEPAGSSLESSQVLADAVALSHKKKCCSGNLTISDLTVRGEGQILADQCILQDRAYWEATVETLGGGMAIGVASPSHTMGYPLTEGLSDGSSSWAWHAARVEAGDVIGVALDQADFPVRLRFYVNGAERADLRGPVTEATPILELSGGGSKVKMNFGSAPFVHRQPGFEGLIRSRSLI